MAGAVVHEKFFSDCLKDSAIKQKSPTNNCNIYAQGHDLLLYIEVWNFIKNRQISLLLSNYKFQEFIYNYLKTAIENGSIYEIEDVKLFIYGYISHHILDSYFHPYIMQYCEDYLPAKNKKWLHGTIETLYDSSFIKEHYKEDPLKFKLYKNLRYTRIKDKNFINNINQAGIDTYNVDCLGKKINIAFHSMNKYMYLYRYDPTNFKKFIGRIYDKFTSMGSETFFYTGETLEELEQYKNNDNKEWINYWSKNQENVIKSKEGLDELYNHALEVTRRIIDDLEEAAKYPRISFNDITDIVPNTSAITGMRCGTDLPFIKKKKGIRYE